MRPDDAVFLMGLLGDFPDARAEPTAPYDPREGDVLRLVYPGALWEEPWFHGNGAAPKVVLRGLQVGTAVCVLRSRCAPYDAWDQSTWIYVACAKGVGWMSTSTTRRLAVDVMR